MQMMEHGGTTLEYTPFDYLKDEYKDLKYSSDANYIIFPRHLTCLRGEYSNGEDDLWTPIHLSGKMEGRLNMKETTEPNSKPTIRKCQGGAEWSSQYGDHKWHRFLLELSRISWMKNTLGSAGTAVVKNIRLEQVDVNNMSTEVDPNVDSLIEGVLGLLGGLVGGLLEG